MNVQVHGHRGMSGSVMRRGGHVLATRRHGGLHHTRGGGRMVTREHGPPMETRCARHRRRMLQLEGTVTSAGTTDDTTPGCASGTSASAVHPPPFHHECRWYLRRLGRSRTFFLPRSPRYNSLKRYYPLIHCVRAACHPRTLTTLARTTRAGTRDRPPAAFSRRRTGGLFDSPRISRPPHHRPPVL